MKIRTENDNQATEIKLIDPTTGVDVTQDFLNMEDFEYSDDEDVYITTKYNLDAVIELVNGCNEADLRMHALRAEYGDAINEWFDRYPYDGNDTGFADYEWRNSMMDAFLENQK